MKSDYLSVIKRDDLVSEIGYLWKHLDDSLSDEQMEQIHQKMLVLTNVDEAVKQSHIDDINCKFYAKTEKELPVQSETALEITPDPENTPERICPRCGAPMILRTAKKGDNAGKQFYGCSAFPKCRCILNIEE